MTGAFSDAWKAEVPEIDFGVGEKSGKIQDEGIRIVGNYHATVSPAIFYPNPNFTCPSCPFRKQCDARQEI